MLPKQRFPWQLAVWAGYAAVILLALTMLKSPWNLVVTGVVLFKALAFLAILKRAQRLGAAVERRAAQPEVQPSPPQE